MGKRIYSCIFLGLFYKAFNKRSSTQNLQTLSEKYVAGKPRGQEQISRQPVLTVVVVVTSSVTTFRVSTTEM